MRSEAFVFVQEGGDREKNDFINTRTRHGCPSGDGPGDLRLCFTDLSSHQENNVMLETTSAMIGDWIARFSSVLGFWLQEGC